MRYKKSNAPDVVGVRDPADGWVGGLFVRGWWSPGIGAPPTSHTIYSLDNSTLYDVQVRAHARLTALGRISSAWSATSVATPSPTVVTDVEVLSSRPWAGTIQLRGIGSSGSIGCGSVAQCSTSFTLDSRDPGTKYVVQEIVLSSDGDLAITLDRPFPSVLDDLYLYALDMRQSYGDWCLNIQKRAVGDTNLRPFVSDPHHLLIGSASTSNGDRTATWSDVGLVWFTERNNSGGQTIKSIMPKTNIGFVKPSFRIVVPPPSRDLIPQCPVSGYNAMIEQLERAVGSGP